MWRCPPASGTPFIGRPRAKKKSRGPTEEGRPKQNFLVYPRTSPHRQADAIMSAASSTLERDPELIDAKDRTVFNLGELTLKLASPQPMFFSKEAPHDDHHHYRL